MTSCPQQDSTPQRARPPRRFAPRRNRRLWAHEQVLVLPPVRIEIGPIEKRDGPYFYLCPQQDSTPQRARPPRRFAPRRNRRLWAHEQVLVLPPVRIEIGPIEK